MKWIKHIYILPLYFLALYFWYQALSDTNPLINAVAFMVATIILVGATYSSGDRDDRNRR